MKIQPLNFENLKEHMAASSAPRKKRVSARVTHEFTSRHACLASGNFRHVPAQVASIYFSSMDHIELTYNDVIILILTEYSIIDIN
jgi:hypothetical protein